MQKDFNLKGVRVERIFFKIKVYSLFVFYLHNNMNCIEMYTPK